MASGMIVKLAELDDDYFGLEIYASRDFNGTAVARLSFRVEAAAVDQFVNALREVEKARSGEANLPASR
jgi:hypothetical protein